MALQQCAAAKLLESPQSMANALPQVTEIAWFAALA